MYVGRLDWPLPKLNWSVLMQHWTNMPAYSHLLSSRELSTESSYAGSSERSEGFSKKVRKLEKHPSCLVMTPPKTEWKPHLCVSNSKHLCKIYSKEYGLSGFRENTADCHHFMRKKCVMLLKINLMKYDGSCVYAALSSYFIIWCMHQEQ